MTNQPDQEQARQIADALASGRKIEAIKLYRQATGKDLKEAKDFIEALIPELVEKDPEKYVKLSRGSGCTSVLILLISLVTVAMLYITNCCNWSN